jgi:hypothetical protein
MNRTYLTADEGLGTAYERVAIYRLFDRWLAPLGLQDAMEGPLDGMSGIPGLHLVGRARAGTRVTVELPDEEALGRVRAVYRHLGMGDRLSTQRGDVDPMREEAFDLVVSYHALASLRDWEGYLARLARRARRYLLVVVVSPYSYAVRLTRAMARFGMDERARALLEHPSIWPEKLEPALGRLGTVRSHSYLDCPWWPETLGDSVGGWALGTARRLPVVGGLVPKPRVHTEPAAPSRLVYGPELFPYLPDHPAHGALRAALRKHPVFDERGETLARWFGHLHAYLVERP